MQIFKSTLLALLACSLLAACGLKGPLYLPEDETIVKPDTTQSSTATEQEKAEKEDNSES